MKYWAFVSIFLLVIPFVVPAFGADWYDSNWLKARKITIDETDIDTANLTNYPLYVNMTLVNVGTDSQADCDDFVFTDSTNVTKLDHEIETCDDANNWAEFWVEVPTVYFDADTIIYMYYDNAGTTDQQSTQATWNSNYQMVVHLNGTFIDSTSSPITCTNSGTSAISDEYVGDSRSWDGIDDYIDCGSDAKIDDIFTSGGTLSAWINPNNDGEGGAGRIMEKQAGWIWRLGAESGNNVKTVFFHEAGVNDGFWASTNLDIDEQIWNYVVVSYDKDNPTTEPLFYVDGIQVDVNDDLTVDTPVTDNAKTLCLGGNSITAGGCNTLTSFDGEMDELRLYDAIQTPEWVKADWECQRGAVDGNSCITVGAEGTEPAAATPIRNAIAIYLNSPTTTRLGGIFAGVCDFANNYTMIGIWPNGTIRCAQLP